LLRGGKYIRDKYMELTKSEQKIVEYMKQGLTFRQIAGKMGISVTEVSKVVNELYTRFNVYGRLSFLQKIDKEAF